MEFDKNEYKTVEVKFKSEEEKNKFFIAIAVLVLLVIVMVFFLSKKNSTQEADNSANDFKVPDPAVQVEMAIVFQKFGEYGSNEDFNAKTYYLQFVFAVSEQEKCLMGLKRVRELHQAGFLPEALFEYATVMHLHLNEKIKPFVKEGSKPRFKSAINIAYQRKVIDQDQRDFLHKLRRFRNIKAHEAGVTFDKEITEMFLSSKLNLIETTIV